MMVFVEITGQSLLLTKTCHKPAECEHNCRENLIKNFYDSWSFKLDIQILKAFELAVSLFCFGLFFRKRKLVRTRDAVTKVVIIVNT
jgi:hypothetical protein